MDRWKAAPRASRKEDDALWARFRAAQQVFFDARRAKDEAVDSEYQENLTAKEALLAEAEALLPLHDLEDAKRRLRSVQDRWDEAGRVPSADVSRIEGRMRAVEDAVRAAEEREWNRSNPETKARAEGMLGQLEEQVAQLRAEVEAAEAAGDTAQAADLRDALTTKQAWLDQIRSSMA
jgi:excinuclease UvrABC helicase subunit UvrB